MNRILNAVLGNEFDRMVSKVLIMTYEQRTKEANDTLEKLIGGG